MRPTTIIIPVAGYGRRFREAGYTEEKPLILVGGKTLLAWSVESLGPGPWGKVVLIAREEQPLDEFAAVVDTVLEKCRVPAAGLPTSHIGLPGPTQGAACTVLAGAVGLPPEDPVLVMNADQWFRCDLQRALARAEDEGWAGFVLTFDPGSKDPKWSYAVTNGADRVVWIVEKKPVSNLATVGVYWWRSAALLVKSACAAVASGQRTNNEFYLAPVYNFAPLADHDVRIVPVDEFRGLGTPEQVQAFAGAARVEEP